MEEAVEEAIGEGECEEEEGEAQVSSEADDN